MIFYIHGFNSLSTGSKKIEQFKEYLDRNVRPIDYNSFDTFENNKKAIHEKIKDYKEKIFIGTSLGGYYAAMLAKEYNGTAVMLNPAINLTKRLFNYIGPHENYTTGEKGYLTEETILSYPHIEFPEKVQIIINAGDEVIPYQETLDAIGSHHYIMFPGGAHRFEDVKEVSGYIKSFLEKE